MESGGFGCSRRYSKMSFSGMSALRTMPEPSQPLIFISLLICGGVSSNSGIASTFVCSDGTSGDCASACEYSATLKKVQTPFVQTALSACNCRLEPPGNFQKTIG